MSLGSCICIDRSAAVDILPCCALAGVDLDFSRYGETLFEVLFAGGRMAGGGNVIQEGKKLDTNVRDNRQLQLQLMLPGQRGQPVKAAVLAFLFA